MILVTRLDGKQTVVNEDLILMVEDTPDTVLTFSTGGHMVVKESVNDIVNRTIAFRRRTHPALAVMPPPES
ncbi:MAG: flagellar FlbD family protein [Myxococcaceae bacterium]|nr:flagellar FlbD family protein [Myxococcaceae bacterium]